MMKQVILLWARSRLVHRRPQDGLRPAEDYSAWAASVLSHAFTKHVNAWYTSAEELEEEFLRWVVISAAQADVYASETPRWAEKCGAPKPKQQLWWHTLASELLEVLRQGYVGGHFPHDNRAEHSATIADQLLCAMVASVDPYRGTLLIESYHEEGRRGGEAEQARLMLSVISAELSRQLLLAADRAPEVPVEEE